MKEYEVVEYLVNGDVLYRIGAVAGHGKNKGTWDSTHSRSSAYRLKKELESKNDGLKGRFVYEVEQA